MFSQSKLSIVIAVQMFRYDFSTKQLFLDLVTFLSCSHECLLFLLTYTFLGEWFACWAVLEKVDLLFDIIVTIIFPQIKFTYTWHHIIAGTWHRHEPLCLGLRGICFEWCGKFLIASIQILLVISWFVCLRIDCINVGLYPFVCSQLEDGNFLI